MRCIAQILLLVWVILTKAVAQQEEPIAGSSCQGANLEQFQVRDVRIEHPFRFVGSVLNRLSVAQSAVASLKGKQYSLKEAEAAKSQLLNEPFLSEAGSSLVRFSYAAVFVDQCKDGGLDLIFQVFSSQVSPSFGGLFESLIAERTRPQEVAGVTDPKEPLRFSPQFRYDRSERFAAGGRMELAPSALHLPIDHMVVEGRQSNNSQHLSASLSGVTIQERIGLGRLEWQLNYLHSVAATDRDPLRQNRLLGQIWAATKPLGGPGVVLRFGVSAEGGNQHSDFATAELSANTVARAGYGSLKFFGGQTFRTRRHSVAASYGVELGATESGPTMDYAKHVGDVAYSLWIPVADHRQVELESRFSAGGIGGSGSIPAPKRFFGGNTEQNFLASNVWMIRANPVLRSFPSNRFYHTADGVGGDRFFSYNLTAAFPGPRNWHRPLVPVELTKDGQFPKILNGALITTTSTLSLDYAVRDPAFQKATAQFSELGDSLKQLETKVKDAQAGAGGMLEAEFRNCLRRTSTAQRRLRSAIEAKSGDLFGFVKDLLDPAEGIALALKACATDLNSQLQNGIIEAETKKLETIRSSMAKAFEGVNMMLAVKKAEIEMGVVKRTLNTIFEDINLFSVSPLFTFDVGRLGRESTDGRGGVRYGLGGGVRFTLVSHVVFDAGYAWNVRRRMMSEPKGAFFFAMTFRDLFE